MALEQERNLFRAKNRLVCHRVEKFEVVVKRAESLALSIDTLEKPVDVDCSEIFFPLEFEFSL